MIIYKESSNWQYLIDEWMNYLIQLFKSIQ